MVSPQVKRQAVDVLREERGLGVTRACGLVGISRSLYGYRTRRPDSSPLRERIGELAVGMGIDASTCCCAGRVGR